MRLNKSARGFAVVCVAAVAMVVVACEQSQPEVASVAQSQTAAVNSSAKKATPARVQTKNQPKNAAASKTSAAAGTTGTAPAPEAASKALAQEAEVVTITGCLEERKDQTFRLKNTTGVDAPKSRGWKSGFLKKGSTSIDLVDAANRAKLQNHVGEQISVTGMLADKEMQVRSLKRVAESCE
jgi:hypothetical protein